MVDNKNVVVNGNVIMVDPNYINVNNTKRGDVEFVNGIPQYQDMYIFAELTAESKGRTVLEIGGKSTSSESQTINLMGNNQDKDSPDYLRFTTNFYDGSTGNKTQYESFGISNIGVKINSSYVPQVNIQFVDVRGLSFFNQENSPYRILFDFPPPIFKLTIKGYYGKPITYQLHLVKYTTEFQSQSGNFIIDAQFVAMTFAPLSDVLFRYIVNFPLIDNPKSADPVASKRPVNTNSMLLKLKNLYTGVENKIRNSAISKQYDNTKTTIDNINLIIDIIKQFKDSPEIIEQGRDNVFLINKQMKAGVGTVLSPETEVSNDIPIQVINNLLEYDEKIKSTSTSGIPVKMWGNRLSIAFIAATNINEQDDEGNGVTLYSGSIERKTNLITALSTFRNKLLKNTNDSKFNISESDIPNPSTFFGDHCISPYNKNRTEYVELDITDFYLKLYKNKIENIKTKSALGLDIATEINTMVTDKLGMIPTIYNIFKIILDDVDIFFNKLRDTAEEAERKHQEDKNKLDSKFDLKDNSVYAFPLVINNSVIHGGITQERIAPIKLQEEGIQFPELELVQKFIDSFSAQGDYMRSFEAKNLLNDDGSYKWIPITPQDSILTDNSPVSPYIDITDNYDDIFKILLKRFYILSQGTLTTDFYNEKDIQVNDAYIKYYANAEATNISISLNSKSSGWLNERLIQFEDINYFYNNYLKFLVDENGVNLYEFPDNTIEYLPITVNDPSNGIVYVNKNNEKFVGMNIYNGDITMQEFSENSKKPIDEFINNAKKGFWGRLFQGSSSLVSYNFTQENVIYINDYKDGDSKIINSLNMDTRYVCHPFNQYYTKVSDNTRINANYPRPSNSINGQIVAYSTGNFGRTDRRETKKFDYHSDVLVHWTNIVSDYGTSIYTEMKKNDNQILEMLFLSNFGFTLSPFNGYPNQLNTIVFDAPSVIEVPMFLNAYVGMLLAINEDTNWKNKVLKYFTGATGNTLGNTLPNRGYYILADLHDVDKYLSINDKKIFTSAYQSFRSSNFNIIKNNLNDLFIKVIDNKPQGVLEYQLYDYYLNPNSSHNFSFGRKGSNFEIFTALLEKTNIVNFNQSTFKIKDLESYDGYYKSLASINTNDKLKIFNDKFFTIFFQNLKQKIISTNKELNKQKEEQKKLKGDIDIVTQTYYSFKNINDKWLTGGNKSQRGYPYNEGGQNLIDKFAFVDRAMNPIANTIINAETLVQIFNDPNITVFTALSQLLSANGFEFFPLQNFLSFNNENGWENCFKIQTGVIGDNPSSHFVCMYIGGSSSYPSVDGNGFKNDGIIDLTKDVTDFKTTKPNNDVDDENTIMSKRNGSFPWRQVRAFRVRFAEQSQSMFIDMKIDGKEYPETNESIQILSRLAGDDKNNAPAPKAQNLYNLYENRAYGATVTMLGNAMIQPTQYFQLENIPLFNGAYIILNVEHSITPNKMTTTFSGTKLLEYPIPRVTNPLAFTGFDGEFASMSSGEIVRGAIVSEYNQTKINAMYNLRIG